ncbi:MAG: phosphatase PAP2 family protein [Roseiarcus sp.]|jgi:membrane-associated phospholipid phosphatase
MRGNLSKALGWVATSNKESTEVSRTPAGYSSSPVWIACLVSTLFAILVVLSTGMQIAWSGFVLPIEIVAALAAVHFAVRLGGRTPELETAPGVIAAISWSGLMALIATHAGLRADNPLIDDALARADSLLGFDAPWLIGAVSGRPFVTATLSFVYHSALLALFATAVALSFGKLRQRSWDIAFSFAFGSIVCGAVSVAYPAVGTFAHYRIGADVVAGLPKGAGTFYMPVFEAFRSGAVTTIDFDQLTGVVTFPSFHGAIALMTAFALRDVRWVAPVAWLWCVLVHVSTIPMGGHYGTDLVVGGLLWCVSVWLNALVTKRTRAAYATARPLPAFQG